MAVLAVLLPELGDEPRRGDDVRSGDQHDVFPQRQFDQLGRGFQRGMQGLLDRNEEKHEIGGFDAGQGGVIFGGQLLDVPFERVGMLFGRDRPFFVFLRTALPFVGVERDFGVDDDLALPRQIEHHVGLEAPAFLRRVGKLGVEVLAFDQPGFLQHGLEDHLAPVAARLGLAFERAGQVRRFARDGLVQLAEALHFGAQLGARIVFLAVGLFHLGAEFFQPLGKRTEQLFELRAVLFGEALRFVLEDAVSEILDLRFERAARLLESGGFLFLAGQLGGKFLHPPEQVAPVVFHQLQLPGNLVGARARGGQFGQGADRLQASQQISDHPTGQQHGDGPPIKFGHGI